MSFPRTGPFTNFGGREGDATSAEFLRHVERELFAVGQSEGEPPLEVTTGPYGTQITLERDTFNIRRVQFTEDLNAGGSAVVTLLTYATDTGTWNQGEQFTVYDPFGQTGQPKVAKTNDYGLAYFSPEVPRWEVLRPTDKFFDDFFPAYISARTTVSSIYSYSWTEYEATAVNVALTSKSGGRSGTSTAWPAVELNNQKVNVGSIVWMKRVFRAPPAVVSLTKTTPGNSMGTPAAFSLYVDAATAGTYTVTFDGATSATIAYNASAATTKAAIEATTSGLSLSSFSGAGTLASPWTFTVSSDTADHAAIADGASLRDASGYAFAAPAGSNDYVWTATKTADYTAEAGDGVVCDLSSSSFTVTLPEWATTPTNARVGIQVNRYAGTRYVSVAPHAGDKIRGNTSTWALLDKGLVVGVDWSEGGFWEFIRTSNSDCGWSCSRFLNT